MSQPSLLWHSNAPWSSTGYGQQTALFAPRLTKDYNVVISSFYGLEGSSLHWNGLNVLPGIGGEYGNQTLPEHAQVVFNGDPRGGTVLTLMDVWVLDWEVFSDFDVVSWVPVDHEPTPAPVRRFFERSGAVPMAMSKFGAEQLTNDGLEPLYVPHAVDTQNYRLQDKAKAREKVGLPADDFIVGMVAANKGNPSRKCFAEAFQAFKVLHDRHPEARLYLHTEMNGRFDGVNLPALLTATGIDLKAVSFADQYRVVHLPITQKSMAGIYSSMDVLLSPSAGEGFGIPVVEAQAAGVPVIVSDFSAQPELCASGWTVEGTKTYTPIGSWQFRPNVECIADRLETAYALRDDEKQRKAARDLAKQYDVRRVLDKYMLPALEQARERFAERKPTKLEPVAA